MISSCPPKQEWIKVGYFRAFAIVRMASSPFCSSCRWGSVMNVPGASGSTLYTHASSRLLYFNHFFLVHESLDEIGHRGNPLLRADVHRFRIVSCHFPILRTLGQSQSFFQHSLGQLWQIFSCHFTLPASSNRCIGVHHALGACARCKTASGDRSGARKPNGEVAAFADTVAVPVEVFVASDDVRLGLRNPKKKERIGLRNPRKKERKDCTCTLLVEIN